ncbi:MAG: type 4a pilus biogenesis protein PilO [candidate division Zixibacteria bacterium]|nr:type 4a pilus biogenesis protein PilO [candidate division Zixibacteria bacterium]
MDFRDPKNQKIIIVAIAFILLAYVWYDRLYTKTNIEIAERYGQYEALLTKLNQVEQKAKNLEKLKAEYNDLLTSYRPMQDLLPETLEFSTFLNQVHAAAQATRSIVFEMSPKGQESSEFYKASNYEISMATTFHDMGNFLANVANFPFIVNVSKVKLSMYKDIPQKPKIIGRTLMADFTLTTYNAKYIDPPAKN